MNKTRVVSCDKGQRLALGESSTLDDWRCLTCARGEFAPVERAVVWDSSSVSNPVVTQCTAKAKVNCAEPGSFFQQGNSAIENDWGCESNPTTIALCSKEYQAFTRTTLGGLMVGMPELVAPFTKMFTASIKAPGYSRVKARAVAVVTGDRFVSNGERLAFPKSRPLLVLHDPPGKCIWRVSARCSRSGRGHSALTCRVLVSFYS